MPAEAASRAMGGLRSTWRLEMWKARVPPGGGGGGEGGGGLGGGGGGGGGAAGKGWGARKAEMWGGMGMASPEKASMTSTSKCWVGSRDREVRASPTTMSTWEPESRM